MVQRFKPHKVAYIDVDGTLIINGKVNQALVRYLGELKAAGFELNLWSANGKAHAERAAKAAGITDVFTHILTKPDLVVDDLGWSWTRYVKTLHPTGAMVRKAL